MNASVKQQIDRFADEVGAETVAEFISRLDDDYFDRFTTEDIHNHLQMASRLTLDRPVQLKLMPTGAGKFEFTVVGLDYFSVLSIICGLISAFAFNIDSGLVFTFSAQDPLAALPPRLHAGHWRRQTSRPFHPRKMVDVFRVSQRDAGGFGLDMQAEFGSELESLILLLRDRFFAEARDRVNRRLVEYLDRAGARGIELDCPIETRFDNSVSDQGTELIVRSKDTPAFLYSLTNGLAMRGVYIQKARIENVGNEAADSFFISDRRGNKIESEQEQKRLATAVGLIKQFTQSLPAAPDPAKALTHFDQFLDAIVEKGLSGRALMLFGDPEGLGILANLLGSSDFLWEDILRTQLEDLLPILEEIKEFPLPAGREAIENELAGVISGASSASATVLSTRSALKDAYSEKRAALNRFKDREIFLIDMKRLLHRRMTLDEFSNALTDLAEAIVSAACELSSKLLIEDHGAPRLESGESCGFAVFGLGKFGGREMGYASDIELLLVYEGQGQTSGPDSISNHEFFDRLVQQVSQFIEAKHGGIFEIDLRLRPHGSAGALASSLGNIREYYCSGTYADPFERQALIKLRAVAGDKTLARAVEDHRDEFVYSPEPWDVERALHLRARQIRELVEPGKVSVKYGPGGIIDIEYAAQYLQIIHGASNPELRTPSTLVALEALRSAEILPDAEHLILREAYVFLRQLQDSLRMVRGHSRDVVLPDEESDEFKFLARRLGYHDVSWSESSRHLAKDIHRHRAGVNRVFLGRFKPPGKDRAVFSI
jgi:glutamate-ammonia-ligase adenylyltransferase